MTALAISSLTAFLVITLLSAPASALKKSLGHHDSVQKQQQQQQRRWRRRQGNSTTTATATMMSVPSWAHLKQTHGHFGSYVLVLPQPQCRNLREQHGFHIKRNKTLAPSLGLWPSTIPVPHCRAVLSLNCPTTFCVRLTATASHGPLFAKASAIHAYWLCRRRQHLPSCELAFPTSRGSKRGPRRIS